MKRLTTNEFIQKSINIHGGSFEQTPKSHLLGKNCKLCINNNILSTKEEFINKAIKIHGQEYIYSDVVYVNNETKVNIICRKHGIFEQTPNRHLSKNRCPICYGNIRLTTEEFISNAIKIHGDKYDYSLVDYVNNRHKVKIICKKHGIFIQKPLNHIGQKQGCPLCEESKGENKIRNFLNENKIIYEREKRFINCRYKQPIPFDFYLPNDNICIEYNGIQHYESIEYFGGESALLINKQKDKIKKDFCKENTIYLIVVSYKKIHKINDILQKIILKNGQITF